jgi:uncharacterized membrane protein
MSVRDICFPVLAALCYSTNPILIKLGLRSSNEPLLGAAIGMVVSTVVYGGYFLLTGQARDLRTVPWRAAWYFACAGISSTLGVFTFFAAHQYIPAAVVAPLTATAPLVTLTLSYFLLHKLEQVTRGDVWGTVLIVLGVVLLVS